MHLLHEARQLCNVRKNRIIFSAIEFWCYISERALLLQRTLPLKLPSGAEFISLREKSELAVSGAREIVLTSV
jgi:hypothetical protein